MNGRLFWAGIFGFFAGIAAADLLALSWHAAGAALLSGAALLFLPRTRVNALLAALLFAAAFGVARMNIAEYAAGSSLENFVGERVSIIGKVDDEPDRREQTARLIIRPDNVLRAGGREEAVSGSARVIAAAPLPTSFSYGDTIRIDGVLGKPESFDTGGGRRFDYPSYLAARGIRYEVPFPQATLIGHEGWSVRGALFSVKQAYLTGLSRALPEPYSSLAGGITVGDKRSLGEELSERFRRTGLVHIVVLSGYNITLIVGALMLLVRSRSLAARFIFGGGVIMAFVLMTGASATGIRAGAMATLALLAAASYRKYAIDRALSLTAAGMVLWNPYTLLHDPGFQLSVIATLGLIHLSPLIAARLGWVTDRLQMREIVAATVGTQIAVLPLLLYQTGLLSLVSLPANLLVLPAIPAAMVASFIAGVSGIIYDTIGTIAGLPAYALLRYVVWMTELLARIPFSAAEIPAFSGWWVVAAYLLLLTALRKYQKKKAGSVPADAT